MSGTYDSFQGSMVKRQNPGIYRNMWITAGAFAPRSTNGAEANTEEYATNDINLDQFLFDATTEEGIQAQIAMPDEWDRGIVKAKMYWDPATGASANDGVAWGISAGALSDDDVIDTALGTEVVVTDLVLAVGDLHITDATGETTIGGTPALGDLTILQIVRKVSNPVDDMTEDAKLFGVMLQYKESACKVAIW